MEAKKSGAATSEFGRRVLKLLLYSGEEEEGCVSARVARGREDAPPNGGVVEARSTRDTA